MVPRGGCSAIPNEEDIVKRMYCMCIERKERGTMYTGLYRIGNKKLQVIGLNMLIVTLTFSKSTIHL